MEDEMVGWHHLLNAHKSEKTQGDSERQGSLVCCSLLLLLLSHFSRVRPCVKPEMAAHQAPRPWDSPGKNTRVDCHFLLQCMKVKSESEVAQLCPTLRDPMDCSLPGSSIHGIFQARVLEWGAIAFSVLQSTGSQRVTQLSNSTITTASLLNTY